MRSTKMTNFKIQDASMLAASFVEMIMNSRITQGIFVDSSVRKEWILNHKTLTVNGRPRELRFVDHGGGVYEAILVPNKDN